MNEFVKNKIKWKNKIYKDYVKNLEKIVKFVTLQQMFLKSLIKEKMIITVSLHQN